MRHVLISGVLVFVTGCAPEPPASQLETNLQAVGATKGQCARIDGVALGVLPLRVPVGDGEVELLEWTTSDERSLELFGFAAKLPTGVTYTVQAGDRRFSGRSPRWLHPLGLVGPQVRPIESITFCGSTERDVLASAASAPAERSQLAPSAW